MRSFHQHTAFLCGHFKMSAIPYNQQLINLGWERFNLPDEVRKTEKRFFYPEFVDFCYSDESDNSCIRFVKHINQDLSIILHEKEICFSIKELTLYIMPFNMALFFASSIVLEIYSLYISFSIIASEDSLKTIDTFFCSLSNYNLSIALLFFFIKKSTA